MIVITTKKQEETSMPRVTQAQASENRAKIIAAADRLLREKGYDGWSTAAAAKAAGLTEGALFRNFPTKAALGAAAMEAGFAPILALLDTVASPADLGRYIDAYLGTDHRDWFPWGCPVAALGTEMHRHPEPMKAAFHAGFEAMLDRLAPVTEGRAGARVLVSTLAGALGMARALRASGHRPEADAILADTAAALKAQFGVPSPP